MTNAGFEYPPRRILVPIDFSEASLAALAAAMSLGRRWSSSLELVHIASDMPPGLVQGADIPWTLRRLEEYRGFMKQQLARLAGDYLAARVRLEDGDPASELSAMAGPETAYFRTGITPMRRLLLGSVAESVVRSSRVPVLTVAAKPAPEWPRQIVVPMRVAPYADDALRCALTLAADLRAFLSMLHVAKDVASADSSSSGVEEHVKQVFGERYGAPLGRMVGIGKPARMILKAIEREGFDLVVLSAHHGRSWKDELLGGTAERVLRHSPVPVLSIPAVAVEATP
jgi:nucleotide-binding universal stress UspA family protein